MEHIIKLITGRPLITCLVVGVVLMSMWWLKFRRKLNMKWYWAPILSVLYFVVSLISVKLLALIEVGFDVERAANMRLYGAIFVLPELSYFVAKRTKRDPALVVDIMGVCATIGLFAVRINCLIAGCCDGVHIAHDSIARWPLVEMEMILCVVLCLYFWNKVYRRQTKGTAYPTIILIYGIFRFIIEWFREEYTGQLWIFHSAHIWSIIAIVGSAIAIHIIKKNRKKHVKRRESLHNEHGANLKRR